MALVKCPDCGRDVSGRAIACPYCGCPVSEVITQQRDDSDNFFEQGDKYYRGKGVPQDFQKAAEWYQKAAEQGHAKAQFNLGVMYANGEGVSQNYEEAVK